MSLHHERQRADERTVRLQCGKRTQVHAHVPAPAQDDVEVRVRDRELVAHQVVLVAVLQQVLRHVLQLRGHLLQLRLLRIARQTAEQRTVRRVHLAGQVVERVLDQVSLRRAVLARDRARSLCRKDSEDR